MASYTLVYNFVKWWEKQKKNMIAFLVKQSEEKQTSATIMISVHGKGQFFQWSWNYKVSRFKKILGI